MKKSIIAIAVSSAAMASVSTYAAEDSTVDIYGNIQYAITDTEGAGDFEDNGSTFGFKGETKVDEDLTAFFKYELEADANDKGNDNFTLDQAFVGLDGEFGKVQVGSFDSIYNNAIQDSTDQFEYLSLTVAGTTGEGDTIAYFSPSINGLELQVSTQVNSGNTEGNATTVVAKYNLDAFTVSAGYDSFTDADDTVGLSVDYQVSPVLSVSAKTESTTDVQDIVGLGARYGYGAGDLYGSVQVVSPDAGDDYDEFAAGVTYSLASNVYVFGELAQLGSDEDSTTAVGVYYGF